MFCGGDGLARDALGLAGECCARFSMIAHVFCPSALPRCVLLRPICLHSTPSADGAATAQGSSESARYVRAGSFGTPSPPLRAVLNPNRLILPRAIRLQRCIGADVCSGCALLADCARALQHRQLHLQSSAWGFLCWMSRGACHGPQQVLPSTMMTALQCSTMALPCLALLVDVHLHPAAT